MDILRGGASVGRKLRFGMYHGMSCTWPLASLSVSEETLIVDVVFKSYSFYRNEIEELVLHRGLLGSRLEIKHSKKDFPSLISFRPFFTNPLIIILKKYRYAVISN